jgi:hypothetical protein
LNRFVTLAAVIAASAAFMPPAVAAKSAPHAATARFSRAPIYKGKPNLQATADLVAAGGGASGFDSVQLLEKLAGGRAAGEIKSLTERFGADRMTAFFQVADFAANDAVARANAAHVALPQPSAPLDGKALSATLYGLGTTPQKRYDVEYMLDGLFTHNIHLAVMRAIDAKFGAGNDANYHAVFNQAITDLAQ